MQKPNACLLLTTCKFFDKQLRVPYSHYFFYKKTLYIPRIADHKRNGFLCHIRYGLCVESVVCTDSDIPGW